MAFISNKALIKITRKDFLQGTYSNYKFTYSLSSADFSVFVIALSTVNFSNFDSGSFGEFSCQFFPCRSQSFTMSTPGGEKFDKGDTFFDFSIEIIFVQMSYGAFDLFNRCGFFTFTAKKKKKLMTASKG